MRIHNRTIEDCRIDAKKYNTRNKYKKGNNGSYFVARRNGWLDEVCKHMKNARRVSPWTNELILTEAKKYKYKIDWKKQSGASHTASRRKGIFKECTKHMIRKILWPKELCILEALKYKTRTEWQKKSKGSYEASVRRKWHPECASHMKRYSR